MNTPADPASQLRWSIYGLLIALAVGSMLGRILAVNSVDAIRLDGHLRADGTLQRPFLSANDRSRWATVRSLVEYGTYAIDDVVQERGWDTIDMVKHRARDGEDHLYSSKPPLMATLMAVPYWIIHRVTGATLGDHPYEIGRALLVLFNVLPLVVYFVLLGRLADRFAVQDWSRLFVMSAATFGTFLTTFVVSINNHLPAAVSVTIALVAGVRIWQDGCRTWKDFAVAGLFAAFAAACELPALSFVVLLGLALFWKAPRETLIAFLPAALLVGAAATATNYIAHDSLRPPYMHRNATDPADNWYDYTYVRDGRERESYWRHPVGIDQGEPLVSHYVLHATIGHHGIFSLTPIWLLSIWGLFLTVRNPQTRAFGVLVLTLSIVCLAFYLSRQQADRNYGGMTSGFRWMFWFAPLWLVALLPAADRLSASRAGRGIALVLLALSVLSASYPTWNPWTHPWLFHFFTYLSWS